MIPVDNFPRLCQNNAMTNEPTPCCAHTRILYVKDQLGGGLCSDRWKCADCGERFFPYLHPKPLENKPPPPPPNNSTTVACPNCAAILLVRVDAMPS